VKSYRSAPLILADIKRTLEGNSPCFHRSPLEDVAELLSAGRRYTWIGIYLALDKRHSSALAENAPHPGQLAHPGTRKKILVTIKIAGRELGFLNVESDRENAFAREDRVLLEQTATLLARFLTSQGRYLVRRVARPEPAPRAAAA
jgi:putative methionine-R-sulfoxide reductase with GAF domain